MFEYAVVGAGPQFLTNLMPTLDWLGCSMRAVVDPSDKARISLADSRGIPGFCRVEELTETQNAPPVAIISSPITTHSAIAEKLIESGIHTFVEKPLASSLHEGVELARMANAKGVVLWPGHNRAYSPLYKRLHQTLKGQLLDLDLRLQVGGELQGRDLWLDIGVHALDIVLKLLRTASWVEANCTSGSAWEVWRVALGHEGKAGVITLLSGQNWGASSERLEVVSEEGIFSIRDLEHITVTTGSGIPFDVSSINSLADDLPSLTGCKGGVNPSLLYSSQSLGGWLWSLNAFAKSLSFPLLASAHIAHSLKILCCVDAILESSASEGRVSLVPIS